MKTMIQMSNRPTDQFINSIKLSTYGKSVNTGDMPQSPQDWSRIWEEGC